METYKLKFGRENKNADDTIAIITHGGMINQLYHSFLRISLESDIIICSRVYRFNIKTSSSHKLYSLKAAT